MKQRIPLFFVNPVDTFYDLGENSFKIGNNATFIIDKSTYKELIKDNSIRNDLSKVKVFLYNSDVNDSLAYWEHTYQTVITDIVLSYLGYIPQRSVGQYELKPEYCLDGRNFIDDKDYLKEFQDYMEELNLALLSQHYYCISYSQIDKRRTKDGTILDFPGTLHSETEFAFEEDRANLNSILYCLKRYLSFLVENYGLDNDLATRMYESYSDHIYENYDRVFKAEYFDFDITNEVINYIKQIGYKNLVDATIAFNNIPIKYEDTIPKKYSFMKSR